MVATQPCLLPTGDALGGLQWAWLPLGSLRRAPGSPEPREEEQPEGLADHREEKGDPSLSPP